MTGTDDKLRLGGMALRNGLLVHGPDALGRGRAHRRRRDRGRLRPQAARCAAADGVPGVRGVVRLGEAMAVIPLVKRALPQARLPFQDAAVLGVAAGASLAGALAAPARARRRRRVRSPRSRSAPALFALRGGELAAYHGVEHKAIAAYEQDDDDAARRGQGARPLRLAPHGAAARRQPGRHAAAAPRAREAGRRWRAARWRSRRPRVAVEVFAWCERNSETPLAQRAAPARASRSSGCRHARARRAPARGRPRRARRDPARRSAPTTKVHAALWNAA